MYVEKITRIQMEKHEITILKQAECILQDICDTFTDCEDCPLHDMCSHGETQPSNFLYKCINALPTERKENK